MSAGLEKIRQSMADYLSRWGVPAFTAFPASPRTEGEEAAAAVSLRRCRVEPSGFQNYLGERFEPETGRWEERYGRKAELTFGLDLYAPERGDGEVLQRAFDALAGALLAGGPEGMDLVELSCGQIARDGERRRLMRPVEAVFTTYLCAVSGVGGGFTDFELRGAANI